MRVTIDGIEAEVSLDALNDPRNIALLADVSDGDMLAYITFYRALFGKEQAEKLMDAIAERDGGITTESWDAFIKAAIDKAAKTKNALKN